MLEGPIVLRMNDKDIAEAETTPIPARAAGADAAGGARRRRTRRGAAWRTAAPRRRSPQVAEFYKAEGVVAIFDRGSDSDMSAGGSDLSVAAAAPGRRHGSSRPAAVARTRTPARACRA